MENKCVRGAPRRLRLSLQSATYRRNLPPLYLSFSLSAAFRTGMLRVVRSRLDFPDPEKQVREPPLSLSTFFSQSLTLSLSSGLSFDARRRHARRLRRRV